MVENRQNIVEEVLHPLSALVKICEFSLCGLAHLCELNIFYLKYVDLQFPDWHLINLRTSDKGMGQKICEFAICGGKFV
jgi:hypothetical protein